MNIRRMAAFYILLTSLCVSIFAQTSGSETTLVTDFITRNAPTMVQAGDFVVLDGVLVGYTGSSDYVVIPDYLGIIEIKDDAFAHSGIVSVEIPNGVTTIGFGAFDNCNKLETVTIPGSVTSIGERAFSYSGLASVTIPDSVTSIGWYAFSGCTNLTSVTIPNGITSIGNSAFSRCTSLTSVTIPNTVTGIEKWAFYGCSNLSSVIIPDSVTSIEEGVFYDCSGLTSVIIPDSVTSIGNSAFSGCTGLTSITIPGSVTSIGTNAFSGCTGLQQFVVDQNNNSYTSVDGALFNKNMTSLLLFPLGRTGSYAIPNSVINIWWEAFSDCTSLTSVSIPDSVTSIENWAFYGCSSLTSITIPNSVTRIGPQAFARSGLTSVTMPDTVTSIGDSAFSDCTNLKQITVVSNGGNPAYIRERLGGFELLFQEAVQEANKMNMRKIAVFAAIALACMIAAGAVAYTVYRSINGRAKQKITVTFFVLLTGLCASVFAQASGSEATEEQNEYS